MGGSTAGSTCVSSGRWEVGGGLWAVGRQWAVNRGVNRGVNTECEQV